MATLDNLPADQRAVIQLVLQQGRTYDQIASMLSIDREGVRHRALAALDALGPHTQVSADRRALITDYLLRQLPDRAAADARRQLAGSPSDRAWARVVAAELAPLASRGLPEIPVSPADEDEAPTEAEPVAVVAAAEAPPAEQPPQLLAPPPPVEPTPPAPAPAEAGTASPADARRISRRGGALLLGLLAVAVVAVVVVLITTSGSNKPKQTAAPSSTTASGSTSTARAQVLAQINLTAPNASSKSAGIAEVIRQGTTVGIAIVAQNVPPNTKRDAYAVWLYNSPSDARILGFVNPGVASKGRLSTTGPLPTDAGHFKQLIISRETQSRPKHPGSIILQGQLTGVP
jgi:hypothetical protein